MRKKGRFEQPRNGHLADPVTPDSQFQDFYDEPAPKKKPKKKRCIGWGILSFFLPLIGLILFLAWGRRKPRASKVCGIWSLIGAIFYIVLILGAFAAGSMYYNHMLDKMNIVEMTKPVYTQATEETETQAPETETAAPTVTETTAPREATREDYINFLIVGQAARYDESERFADTMLVCTLNKFDNSLTVTSLLRDAFVQPPTFRNKHFGHIKLTTVYHLGSYYDNGNVAGSMELMNNTLFENFGLEIDYNFEIDFDVFTAILDALGGVQLEITEAEAKYLNEHLKDCDWKDYWYEPGLADLDGWSGLVYARMRKAEGDADSDIKRTSRQRVLMEAVLEKVKKMNIADIQNLANQVLPMVTTNMSKEEITSMLKTMLPMLPSLEFKSGGTCPAEYSGDLVDIYSDGFKHSVLRFVPQTTKKQMRELTLGEKPE